MVIRMEDKLKSIFENINDWLKFAEAKNGIIVAFNGSVILQIFQIIKGISSSGIYFLCLIILLIFWTLSFLIALISFYPRTKILFLLRRNEKISKQDNLLFYGDIAKYSEKDYLQSLTKMFGRENYCWSNFEISYVNQIIINSQITLKKFKYFQVSLSLNLLGSVIPLFILLLHFVIF